MRTGASLFDCKKLQQHTISMIRSSSCSNAVCYSKLTKWNMNNPRTPMNSPSTIPHNKNRKDGAYLAKLVAVGFSPRFCAGSRKVHRLEEGILAGTQFYASNWAYPDRWYRGFVTPWRRYPTAGERRGRCHHFSHGLAGSSCRHFLREWCVDRDRCLLFH